MVIVLLSSVVKQETSNLECIAKTKSVKPQIIKIGCVPLLGETLIGIPAGVDYIYYAFNTIIIRIDFCLQASSALAVITLQDGMEKWKHYSTVICFEK